jgi:hypothetical protein
MAIESFDGEYRFLSNFWLCPVTLGGVIYPSAEHAYQAYKTRDLAVRARFTALATPAEAKRLGRSVELRGDWDRARKPVMLVTVLMKFTQNPDLGRRLAQTGGELLVEGNHWHDNFWGNCTCSQCAQAEGLNYLGLALMGVREVVRAD